MTDLHPLDISTVFNCFLNRFHKYIGHFNINAFCIIDQRYISFITIRNIHSDAVYSHFFEYLQIFFIGTHLFHESCITITADLHITAMCQCSQFFEIINDFLPASFYRKQARKYFGKAVMRSHIQIILYIF